MNYLHYSLDLQANELVEIELDKQANVRLLDEGNFSNYKNRKKYQYFGGLAKKSPARLAPPRAGRWHLVIDLGGYPGSVQASVRTRRGAA